jgi:uncharacterized coiled-coil protein SlyX
MREINKHVCMEWQCMGECVVCHEHYTDEMERRASRIDELENVITDQAQKIGDLIRYSFQHYKRIDELEATIDVMVTKASAKHWPAYDEQQRRIAELEKERDIRDLEQQAKGIEVAVRINLTSYSEPYIVKLMARASEIRNQAKALKEQGNVKS